MSKTHNILIGLRQYKNKVLQKDSDLGCFVANETEIYDDVIFSAESRQLNTLIVGPDNESKNKYIFEPVLKQDIENKDIGITVFDIGDTISNIAYALAKSNRRNVVIYNPLFKNIKINPLKGEMNVVIRQMRELMNYFMVDSPQFFLDINNSLLVHSIKVLKRLLGEEATLFDLHTLINNPGNKGRKMVMTFSRMELKDSNLQYEQNAISDYFLTDYFNERSKTFEHTSGLRAVLNSILYNEKMNNIFVTRDKSDCIEIDFSKHLKNKDVVIIQLQPTKLGVSETKFLTNMLSRLYTSSYLEEKNPEANSLFIKELYNWQSGFQPLFSNSQQLNLKIMADTSNISVLNKNTKDYIETGLFVEFQNFILMPGLNQLDKSILRTNILNAIETDCLNFLEDGNIFVYLLDRYVKGYRQKGVIKGLSLSIEEKEFLEKRIKRYKKEFSKLG